MADLTPTAFRLRYSEFSDYSDPTIQAAIDDAVAEMNETRWGALYTRGAYAMTAHILTTSGASAQPMAGVISRSVGDVSVTYAKGLDDIGSTRYGCEYVRLRALIACGPVVV